ncbi:MAG TPA: hypothetical protein DCQ31_11405 [Bacteroidales bacterium]|nr:hypothetical protein [Bacteroidales bacterium]
MNRLVVIAVREHKYLGFIALPYIISPEPGKDFYHSVGQFTVADLALWKMELSKEVIEMVTISESISETNLLKIFKPKKASDKSFFEQFDAETLEARIVPYIERRICKIIELGKQANLRFYLKKRQFQNLYQADQLNVHLAPAEAVFNFIRTPDSLQYYLSLMHNNENVRLYRRNGLIVTNNPCNLILRNDLYYFENIDGKKLQPFFEKEHIEVPKSAEKKYFETFITNAVRNFTVNADGFTITEVFPGCTPVLSLEHNLAGKTSLRLFFEYDTMRVDFNMPHALAIELQHKDNSYRFVKTYRNLKLENNCVEQLRNLDLHTTDNVFFSIKTTAKKGVDEEYLLLEFIIENKKRLEEHGFTVRQMQLKEKYVTEKANITINVEKKSDWFDVYGTISLGNYEFPFIRLKNNILSGNREFILPNGEVAILPEEWFAQFTQLFITGIEIMGHLHVDFIKYKVLEDITVGLDKAVYEKLSEFDYSGELFPVPKKLEADLRHYQHAGYSWLTALRKNKFGACLADDMGLGKTVQTIAALLNAFETEDRTVEQTTEEKTKRTLNQGDLFSANAAQTSTLLAAGNEIMPTLIVVPTSLIYNWMNELGRFAPHLTVVAYVGPDREKAWNAVKNPDIILTTYGIVRNDAEVLSQRLFFYLILDESQNIKNSDSKTYESVMQLKARYRLALTGTPLENSLTDLWSQMNFLNPGMLGNLQFFKENYLYAIERSNNPERSEQLKSLISPFLLRRTKQEVAKDLPPVTEQIIYCEMSPAQQSLYEKEKSSVRNEILNQLAEEKGKRNWMFILKSLTALRQMANHPKLTVSNYAESSGKFDEMLFYIESICAEDHKVLIFSSFVKHLELIEAELKQRKLPYSMLTGATRNREQTINEFKYNKEVRIFLISLKAGGVGLNLTQADYVFVADPWWNPAAEMQAISRAHRIGQEKNVFVYRFISRNTVEEKIIKLQEKKQLLADMFVNNSNPLMSWNKDMLAELFD